MKAEVKQGNYSNTLYHIKAVSSDFKEICSSQRILDSSTNILHFFVNDLLDFAQIQSNNFKKTLEAFNVKDAIQELIEMQTFQASSKNIKIQCFFNNFMEDYHIVKTDKRRLQQIILNLLSNAIKFTKKGGEINVTASIGRKFIPTKEGSPKESPKEGPREPKLLEVSTLQIAVKDNGAGISKQD